jgi:hypothetical protein
VVETIEAMKLPLEVLFLLSTAFALPLTPRSATLPHLRGLTSLSRDLSTTDSRFPEKYFHESVYHPHYDGRFAATVLPHETRAFHMRLLLRSYMTAMERIGVRTWIMHGTLLGWWWNGRVFPWDSDLDVQVEEGGMRELGEWWNMTVHSFSALELNLALPTTENTHATSRRKWTQPATEETMKAIHESSGLADGVWEKVVLEGKKYLLEINPHYITSTTSDLNNVIDARWIDTSTGLFIDITTVHAVPPRAATSSARHKIIIPDGLKGSNEEPKEMYTKDTRLYSTSLLFPLRRSTFEGMHVSVPYAYETLLLEEYGPRALIETWFNGYEFDRKRKEWLEDPEVSLTKPQSVVKEQRSDGKDAAGQREEQDKKLGRRSVTVEEAGGEEIYKLPPGRIGDVHVVPTPRL